MILFLIVLLLVVISIFCHAPRARLVLRGGAALFLCAAASFLWAEAHLLQACSGTLVDGLDCGTPGLLTRAAMAHLTFGLFALVAGVFVAPTLVILALWLEYRARRRGSHP